MSTNYPFLSWEDKSPKDESAIWNIYGASPGYIENPPDLEFLPPHATESSVTAAPLQLLANGTDSTTITITPRTYLSEGFFELPDHLFNIESTSATASIGAVSETSTGSGVYEAEVTNTVAEQVTFTVTVHGVDLADSPTVDFEPLYEEASTVTAFPLEVAANGTDSSLVTVTLLDGLGNPALGAEADFNIQVTGSASAGTVIEVSAGVYEFEVTNTVMEVVTVTVTVLDVELNTKPTITFLDEMTVQYSATAGGSILGDANQVVLYGKDAEEVTADPDTGYIFLGWSDGVTTASRTDTEVTENISVTAIFTTDYRDFEWHVRSRWFWPWERHMGN